jgi:hypothetical protein
MKRLLREPLIHFLLLGGLLFALYSLAPASREPERAGIVISSSIIQGLQSNFERTWQRAPTDQELDGLIQDYVRTEVLYRAGVEMGLDRDDSIVRSRMRQKVELLWSSAIDLAQPTDAQLQAYLDAHPEDFAQPGRISLQQVYLNPKRGATLADDAKRMLGQLNQPDSASALTELGDPTMLPASMEQATPADIEAVFGPGFAEAMESVESEAWCGPIKSAYGIHLVRVTQRIDGEARSLDEVRDAVKRAWTQDQQRQAAETLYRQLRDRYTVTIHRPEPGESK